MNRTRALLLGAGLVLLAGCREKAEPIALRSLERAGDLSFLCADALGHGFDIDRCPDFDSLDHQTLDSFALVTQTLRGEVALVHLAGYFGGDGVMDLDRTVPGVTPLPVGANPGSIVTTPGSTASFVTSAEAPNKFGIYALPTSCVLGQIEADSADIETLDISNWPACSLPVAPGVMTLLYDPPDADGNLRMSCGDEYVPPEALEDEALSNRTSRCPADLALETKYDEARNRRPAAPGRPKLAVALPDADEVWIIDAQQLLDMPQGGFAACPVEAKISLYKDPSQKLLDLPNPPVTQQVPADLEGPGAPARTKSADPTQEYDVRPSGMAVADGTLYIGDLDAPVIHRLNVNNPCAPTALPPLLPLSYDQPWRVVTTNAIAASPPTTRGQRFVYAVDDIEGSLMMFDVTPGSANRTPIVRPGTPYLPNEAPDRVQLPAPIKDVEFVYRDLPELDPETGVAAIGTLCDPDPSIPETSPPALYRTRENFREGAAPGKLRGLFGFVALTSGQVAVIDVEDFDAPCRRPSRTNPGTDPRADFQGCAGDPADITYEKEGAPTTSDEVSCRVVQPHRPRAAQPFATSPEVGVHAPSLRSFPRLSGPEGETLSTNAEESGRPYPKLLAAKMPGSTPAQVFLGSTLRREGEVDDQRSLELDPTRADRNSVMFMFREPRAFQASESIAVTYEGSVVSQMPGGYLGFGSEEPVLEDPAGAFCSRGVEGFDLVRQAAEERLGISEAAALDAFALAHADYVQITSEIPAEGDEYWVKRETGDQPAGVACGAYRTDGEFGEGEGYAACFELFGSMETPSEARELRIRTAYQNLLELEPRQLPQGIDAANFYSLVDCCFGKGLPVSYVVRSSRSWVVTGSGSGFRHDVTPKYDDVTQRWRCVRDLDPRRSFQRGRIYEHRTAESCEGNTDPGECLACVLDENGPAPADSPCVFENVMLRAALYRGAEPSERAMAFMFDYTGGFVPLFADFASVSSAVSPAAMLYVPQLQELFLADGGSLGLLGVSLDLLEPSREIY